MTAIEYEIKVLEVNLKEMREKLKALWAEFVGIKNFRRYVYDFTPAVYYKWVRLRTDGELTTLCVKEIADESKIDWTQETEIVVDDFDTTHILLWKLGYQHKAYQENIRESWKLWSCAIELDQRPKIPPYMEIEWDSVDAVEKVLVRLGVQDKITTSENTTAVYRRYGIEDLEKIPELKF